MKFLDLLRNIIFFCKDNKAIPLIRSHRFHCLNVRKRDGFLGEVLLRDLLEGATKFINTLFIFLFDLNHRSYI